MKQQENCMTSSFQNKIGCIVMASGMSRRFGENKLLTEYAGKSFIERALEATDLLEFAHRVVVTRTEEVAELCNKLGVDVILHNEPGRNDMVRLGMERMTDMDGVLFCPCDQPLLEQKSVKSLVDTFIQEIQNENCTGDTIVRLSYHGEQGAPVIFGKAYHHQMENLPEKKGGSYILKQHPEKIRFVEAGKREELFDVDTPEDFAYLMKILK